MLQALVQVGVTAKKILALPGIDRIRRGKRPDTFLKAVGVARQSKTTQSTDNRRRNCPGGIAEKLFNTAVEVLVPEDREHGQDTVGLRQCVQRPRNILRRLRE